MRYGLLALVAVAGLALLAVPAASSAWTQAGYDAARTGHAQVAGPATNDTAFVAPLPGAVAVEGIVGPSQPVLVNGEAYVPVEPTSGDDGLEARGIARVDLGTAKVELLVDTNRTPQHIAVDEGRIYAVRDGGLDAYELETGKRLWSAEHPPMVPNHEETFCRAPAITRGKVHVACTEIGSAPNQGPDAPPQTIPFAWRVDAATGESVDTRRLIPDENSGEVQSTLAEPRSGASESRASPFRFAAGISVVNHVAYAWTGQVTGQSRCPDGEPVTSDPCYSVSSFQLRLWALDADGYDVRWTNRTEPTRRTSAYHRLTGSFSPQYDPQLPASNHVTGTSRIVYTKMEGRVQARSPDDGSAIWSKPLGETDLEDNIGGMSSALAGQDLFATSAQTLYRVDTDARVKSWRFPLDPRYNEQFGWGGVLGAEERVYAMAREFGEDYHSTLYAVDADTGNQVFRLRLDPADHLGDTSFGPFASYALGDGVVVAAGNDGTLRVIGETAASLGTPNVTASTEYPRVGGEVRVDLSDTEPGAFGNATRYKAYWSDGTTTGWQEDPVLTHAYNESGDQTARFVVANDANQTASTTETFHVGGDPPPDPNFAQKAAQKALAPGNVDITFGVLGLFVALTGGAVGVARRHHKRSRLQQELDALEQGFEDTRQDPGECEAFLDTRKGRARSLALDGKLNEEQAGIIESRAEELRRELRQGAVEEEFGFLPHALVLKARKMLKDGEVTELEAEAFLAALGEVDFLREEQEALVRERIEDWFARDAGGGAG